MPGSHKIADFHFYVKQFFDIFVGESNAIKVPKLQVLLAP